MEGVPAVGTVRRTNKRQPELGCVAKATFLNYAQHHLSIPAQIVGGSTLIGLLDKLSVV